MASTLNAATFKNSEDLILKQMFDITAKKVSEQDEINFFGQYSLGKEFMETTDTDW